MDIPQTLDIKAALKIQQPVQTVFEAIVNPEKMSGYFIAKSSGPMEQGKTVQWQFPEMEMAFPIQIEKIEKDKYISYQWQDMDGASTLVEMNLQQMNDGTFVTITEKSRNNDAAGIAWLKRNTEGWANFLACLKAYLEFGINLRKGAFDLSQMPDAKK